MITELHSVLTEKLIDSNEFSLEPNGTSTNRSLSESDDASRENRTVLIVDPSEETREVLATALERRGVKIVSTAIPRRGVQLARQVRPDLIVLDLEAQRLSPQEAIDSFSGQGEIADTPLVVLGTAKIKMTKTEDEFVAKPYHFAPLVRKIEEMLDILSEK